MSKLCTSLATDMSYLFNGAGNFVQPIYNWDVSNVTNMKGMFGVFSQWGDTGPNPLFFNQPLKEWDVSNVNNMDYMFYENVNFNQDLSNWCVAKIPTIKNDFANSAWTLPKPKWGTCPD